MEPRPAVITPVDAHMGIDIARSLGKHGIPVYGIDVESDESKPGKYSKYIHFIPGPDLEVNGEGPYLEFLVQFGKKMNCKPVLYPLSDAHALVCSRHREVLNQFYEFVMPDHQTMVGLTTKDGLHQVVSQFNLPAPKTEFINGSNDIECIAKRMVYPAILKPTESAHWHTPEITKLLRRGLTAGRAKVILCKNPGELVESYRLIAQYDDRLLVQEVIPGNDDHLVYISFYLDRQSRPLGIFAGRKFRVIPTGFGSASYVRSYYDRGLVEAGLRLLASVKYQGLGGIEFKKDPRDGDYKLIEVNTRFGMWDGLCVRCGVDLPYIAYCDTLRLPVDPQLTFRQEIIWLDWQRDVRAAIAYRKKGQLTLNEWLKSLKGEKMWAIYSREDWRPGIVFTLILFHRLWNRVRLL